MTATHRLVAAMHTASGTRGHYVAGWHSLMQRDDNLRAAVTAVFGKRMPTLQRLGQWLSEHIGPQGAHLLEGQHSRKRKAWAYRVQSLAAIAEEERQLREAQEAQQAAARAADAAAREAAAKREAEYAASCAAAVERGRREVAEATARYDNRTAAPAEPGESAKLPKDDVRPIWMREGRQPTREEWLEHQRTRGAVHKQAFAGSSSQTDWFVRACEARNRGFR